MNQVGDALEKAGFTPAEVEKLRKFNNLSGIRAVINGLAEIKVVQYIIDCDVNPFIPYEEWKVEEHKKSGQFIWDPAKVKLHLSQNQAEGKSIVGNKLRKELETQPVFNANLLDYLVEHPHLIPEEWKQDEKGRTRYIFFWGTIYRGSDGTLYVRFLYWHGGPWRVGDSWLGSGFGVRSPAAVSVS